MHVSVPNAITNVLLAIVLLKSFPATSRINWQLITAHLLPFVYFSLLNNYFVLLSKKKQFLLESGPHQTDVLVIMNFILELILIILMGKPYFSISTVFG